MTTLITSESTDRPRKFIIRSNQSMTWKENLVFLGVVYVVTAMICMMCLYIGLWTVLPFAGLEMIALTVCLYLVSCRISTCEVVTVDAQQVTVEMGRRRVQKRQIFPRSWTRVTLKLPNHHWYTSQLLIVGTHGNKVEIGRYLDEQERMELANVLTQIIHGQN